jgi:hypothetical protein
MAHEVEHMPSKCEALGLKPSTEKKKQSLCLPPPDRTMAHLAENEDWKSPDQQTSLLGITLSVSDPTGWP